jgi:small subunit ribosomal protein S20
MPEPAHHGRGTDPEPREDFRVANTKSAIKDIRQTEGRRQRNRTLRTKVRTSVKTARAALGSKDASTRDSVAEALRELDRAVTRGILHRNTAARKKSALARRLAAL